MKFYFSSTLKIEEHEGFHFLQDHIGTNYRAPWDDYDFITTFQVYHCRNGKKDDFGSTKILANGYKDTSKYFIEQGTSTLNEKIHEITDALNPSIIVSLATSIDYYQKLRMTLAPKQVADYLEKLGDASYRYDELDKFKEWPGFSDSLLRNSSVSEAILKKGHQIAAGRYVPEHAFTICTEAQDGVFEPVEFEFSNKGELGRSNINLLIGKNGVGKTFILRRLVELITGANDDSKDWPYFHKLLVVAYSPFENFYTKNSLLDALEKKHADKLRKNQNSNKSKKRRRLHVNEYDYIGFKNETDEFSLTWPKEHSARSLVNILQYDLENYWWRESNRFNILFDTLNLCLEFDNIALKTKNGNIVEFHKSSVLKSMDIKRLNDDIAFEEGIWFTKNNQILPLSSGQIIYSYLIPCLVAEIEDESLVIIDEPELYLHPTLEIGLINMLKNLLKETSSYAIIATHSAVMAREVKKSGITILRKANGRTEANKPSFETFGESLELIIGEAFDDYTTKKPYQDAIDNAISKYSDMKDAIKAISPIVGDEALAYVASKLEENSEIELKDE